MKTVLTKLVPYLPLLLSFVLGYGVNSTYSQLDIGWAVEEQRPGVDILVMSESMSFGADAWKTEIARKYPNAVGVLIHGGSIAGKWMVRADRLDPFVTFIRGEPTFQQLDAEPIEDVIARVKAQHPGRLIVMVTCNPGHHRLDVEGVAYALDDVFVLPDRNIHPRYEVVPQAGGNIFEFVKND